jgi:hypothetical protein
VNVALVKVSQIAPMTLAPANRLEPMRSLLLLTSLLASFASFALAKSPVGDWQSVEDLPTGWQITVVTTFTFPCIFEKASDDELICGQLDRHAHVSDTDEIHVRRGVIREIRVEKRNGANSLAAAGLGGGLGAGFGAIAIAGARGPAAYLLGTLGAMTAARTGNDTHLLRGKVIYRALLASSGKTNRVSTSEIQASNARIEP